MAASWDTDEAYKAPSVSNQPSKVASWDTDKPYAAGEMSVGQIAVAGGTSAFGQPTQEKERPGFGGAIKDVLEGGYQVPLAVGSSLLAQPASGFVGAYKAATEGPAAGAKAIEQTQQAMTYKPTGAVGQSLLADVGKAVSLAAPITKPIGEALRKPGEKLSESGYPVAGSLTTGALEGVLPMVLPGILKAATPYARMAKMSAAAVAKKAGESVKTAVEPFAKAAQTATQARQSRMMVGSEESAQSMGSALTSSQSEIAAAIAGSSPELQQIVSKIPINEISKPALVAHIEADSLPKPIRLLGPQATQDPIAFSKMMNERGVPGSGIPEALNKQNGDLIENLDLIRDRVAPDSFSTKTIESSENIIDAYRALDAGKRQGIKEAYKALEDANGGQFPVDGAAIAKNSFAALAKKLKTDYLSGPIRKQLDSFMSGEPMTFEQFEAMRTNLADEIRTAEKAGNGNAAMAASMVRQEMENLPMAAGTGENLKGLADNARTLAKARFDMLKKDPAYKAIVKAEDPSINEKLAGDKFYEKFVLNGKQRQLKTMIDTFGENSAVHQELRSATMSHLKERAGIDSDGRGIFTQAGYNKALETLDRGNKLGLIFDPEGQSLTKTLGNVARRIQFQPKGSFVNNSNTLVAHLASKAGGVLEAVANKAAFGLPVGTLARQALENANKIKNARESTGAFSGVRMQRPKGESKGHTLEQLQRSKKP